jgi:nitrogen regulatory protein P-II 1
MQLITAIVAPHRVDAVREALKAAGIGGMTLGEARGFGRQGGHTEIYRGAEYQIEFVPKVRIELVCADDQADDLVEVIADAARTGSIGDGKIWTTPIGRLVRIRTGEEGNEAI